MSPPMNRRSTKHETRRRQLLDAAMAIVVEEGLDGLTVAGIAKRLDAAVGSLYRYFPGKDALIVGLQERAIRDFHAHLVARLTAAREVLGAQADTAPGRLALIMVPFHVYLADGRAETSRHRLLDTFLSFPSPVLGDEEAREVDEALEPLMQAITSLITGAVDTGALAPGDCRVRTQFAVAAVHGLDHMRKRDRVIPERLRVARILPELLASFLRGWGGRDEDIAHAQALAPWDAA